MKKFKEKYRLSSSRAQWWDYGSNAVYFVTICTNSKEHFFGHIANRKMFLSEIGAIAKKIWMEIVHHFSYVQLGEFVVMPNHVHGIIVIDKTDSLVSNISDNECFMMNPMDAGNARDAGNAGDAFFVETRLIASLQKTPNPPPMSTPVADTLPTDHSAGGITGNKNPMLHDNLSRVIRWYKGRITYEARKIRPDFAWQSRFYDHIIRNDSEHQRISTYIRNNPAQWKDDKFYCK